MLAKRMPPKRKSVAMELEPPSAKKRKSVAGAASYGSKYNEEWESEFPFVSRGRGYDKVYSFYCKVCEKDVSCRHQGIADLKRHEKSGGHHSKVVVTRTNSRLEDIGYALEFPSGDCWTNV